MKAWKSSLVFLIILSLLLMLSACGGQSENGTENDDNIPEQELEETEGAEGTEGTEESDWDGPDVYADDLDDDYVQINVTNNSGQPWFITYEYVGEVVIGSKTSRAWKAEDFTREPGYTIYDTLDIDYGRSLGSFHGFSPTRFGVRVRFIETNGMPGPDGRFYATSSGSDVRFHDISLKGTYGEPINIEWTGSSFREGEEAVIVIK